MNCLWYFGGGATNSTQEDPGNITFQAAGTYNVSLTVTDADGDTDSDTVTISVDTPPADDGGDGGGSSGSFGCFI